MGRAEQLKVEDRLRYMSWSKLSLWENDRNMFYQVYVEGLDQARTPYIELGKKLAVTLENGRDPEGNPILDHLAVFLPSYAKREFEIKASYDGIPLLGVL